MSIPYVSVMEWSEIHSRPDLPGVEVLHAHFVHHRYARHAHEYAVIGLVESGVQSYSYRGVRHRTGSNGIFVVNPDEAHTGEAGDADGYVYRALYPTQEFLNQIVGADSHGPLRFREPVIYRASVSNKLRSAHLAIERGESTVACESLLLDAIMSLARCNGVTAPQVRGACNARREVRRVVAFIEAHHIADVSLARLAGVVEMSPYHLAHVFARDVGLPVHVYAEVVRIRHARILLKGEVSISQIAYQLGFADQSHFTHRFKQFQGVTPGQYRRSVQWSDSNRHSHQ